MTGAVESGGPFSHVSVKLVHLPSGALIAQTTVFSNGSNNGFAFYGLTDGEYEVKATREDFAASPPRRVTVKGADATGIQLALTPLGSIAGCVVIEALTETTKPLVCAEERRATLEETIFIARRDPPPARDDPWQFADTQLEKTPNEKGDFLISALEAGRYRLETKLPGEHWYVRAITLPAVARGNKPIDAARDGFTLKVGERLKDLIVTTAMGAASVRGKITAATEGAKLPARLRVHVIPAERERADDVLGYAQVNANSDGSFTLTNLAPGKYWVLARVIPNDEPNEAALRPGAWDASERAKLRREAEAAKVEIELQPCQRASNYLLSYAPPAGR